ncbi:MAG: hypothetical protein HZB15_01705 [Actinobacteria bacterium]|nr:hypothetical protein [Actinomycetota bacterium]
MKIKHAVASAAMCGTLVAGLVAGGTASAAVPVRGTFTRRVLHMDRARLQAYWNEQYFHGVFPPAVLSSAVAVRRYVAADRNAIGYGSGFVTVYPCGFARPLASNLNFVRGVNTANQVSPKVGQDGRVCLFTSNQTHLVADVSGWYADDFAAAPGFFYEQLTPARIVDTRDGTGLGSRAVGPLQTGEVLAVTVPGAGGVPADDDVRAVTMSVTVADATAAGYITVFPCDQVRPVVSNVNFDPANPVVANLATVRVSSTGQVCFYASTTTSLIVDVQGYFSPRNDVTFTALGPDRVLDTRDGPGVAGSRPARARGGGARRAARRRGRAAERHDHRGVRARVRDGLAVRSGAAGGLVPQLRAWRRPGQPHARADRCERQRLPVRQRGHSGRRRPQRLLRRRPRLTLAQGFERGGGLLASRDGSSQLLGRGIERSLGGTHVALGTSDRLGRVGDLLLASAFRGELGLGRLGRGGRGGRLVLVRLGCR